MIKNNWKKLTISERAIGEAILDEKIDVYNDKSIEVAKKLSFSPALINKFCAKLGLSGWKELKGIAIASLYKSSEVGVKENSMRNIYFLLNYINNNYDKIEKKISIIARSITKSQRTIIIANEFSQNIATLFANKLRKIGLNAVVFSYDVSYFKYSKDDNIIFISISGLNNSITEILSKINIQVKTSYISLGAVPGPSVNLTNVLALNVFKKLNALEKVFPVNTDPIVLYILNLIFERIISESPTDSLHFVNKELISFV